MREQFAVWTKVTVWSRPDRETLGKAAREGGQSRQWKVRVEITDEGQDVREHFHREKSIRKA
jgi:hypothetical protein